LININKIDNINPINPITKEIELFEIKEAITIIKNNADKNIKQLAI